MEKAEVLMNTLELKEIVNAIGFNVSDENHYSKHEVMQLLDRATFLCDKILKG